MPCTHAMLLWGIIGRPRRRGEAGSRTHASSDRVGGELLLDLDGLLRAAAVGEGEGARALRGPRMDRR
jgi:hypothetical protein